MKLVSHLSPDFIPGLEVLAHSLAHNGNVGGLEWLLLTDNGEIPGDTLSKLWRWGWYPTVLKMDEVGKDKWIDDWPDTVGHLYYSYNKLRVLLLPPGEYFYLDTDLLCMNDAREMLGMPHISAAPDQPQRKVNAQINLGVLRIDADEDLFDEIVRDARNFHVSTAQGFKRWAPCADQTVLNRTVSKYPGLINYLPVKWNLPTNMIFKDKELWRPEEAVFIHFMGQVKPWHGDGHWVMEKPNDLWRNYYDGNIRE